MLEPGQEAAETDLKDLAEGNAEFDKNQDTQGPVSVAAAAETPSTARVIAFGDSDFVTNAYLNLSGNKDLILNTVSWLSGDDAPALARPKEREVTPLYLKETDQQFLLYGPVLTPPVCFLIGGLLVSISRRRLR